MGGKGRNPRISRIRESADTSVFRFSVLIIRPGFRWGGFGSESGANQERIRSRGRSFAGPVEFTIFRFFRCFACSLSLIHQGNQLGLASFLPPIRRISCTIVRAARSMSGFVRQTPPSVIRGRKKAVAWRVCAWPDILARKVGEPCRKIKSKYDHNFQISEMRRDFFKRRRSVEKTGNNGFFEGIAT